MTPPMTSASPDPARVLAETVEDLAGHLGGAVIGQVINVSDKSLVAYGDWHGRLVVIKVLRTGEQFWRARFEHEIRLYQAFTDTPPPVRVPELLHTDGARVLVVEHIPGQVLDTERYPEHPLEAATLDAVLETVTAFTWWAPPEGVLSLVFDYPDRIERYHRAGFFDEADRAVLTDLLAQAGPVGQANHGDPLPPNLLLDEQGRWVLLDFEFTGRFAPGFDVAMLHTLLAGTPTAQERIEALVADTGIEVPFVLNRAVVLSRELRLHTELPPGPFRDHRLALLRPQWDAFRHFLHQVRR